MAEEDELRDLEVADKERETGGSGIIIGDILCLFDYTDCPLFSPPLNVGVSHKSMKQAKRYTKAGIVRHENNQDM